MIKTVAFDFGGVISEGAVQAWRKKNPDNKHYSAELHKKASQRWDAGEVDLDEAFYLISEFTGIEVDQIWEEIFVPNLPNKTVIELIIKLKKNYKIVLFSNHLSPLLRKTLEHHQLTDLFDEILISSEYKMVKPSPDFFQKLVAISGCKADEIVFIDDTAINIEGSNKFGIKAIHYLNTTDLINDLQKMGIKL